MNPNRRWLVTSIAALAACTRKPQPSRKITVQVSPYFVMAPLHLANERGYFAAENLELNIEESQQAREMVPMLASGRVDVAFAGFVAGTVNAILKGSRIRIVAGRERFGRNCGDAAALFIRKSKFPNGHSHGPSWAGVRMHVGTPAGYREFLFDQLTASLGLSPGAIVPEFIRNDSALAAAASEKPDVVWMGSRPGQSEPEFMKQFDRITILEELFPGFQYSYVLFGPRLIDTDPALGGAFLRALLRGVAAFQAGDTPTFLSDFSKRFKVDYGVVPKSETRV